MKMTEHQRRFSMPPPGFTVAHKHAASAAVATTPLSPASSLTTLAQIYTQARDQALLTVQRRRFDALCDRLFNS
ncbi:MAG TPA: hypothetical protein VMJ32_00360 [Pirellulales bacterium]|nr:hypothetical protein [Pirellulales bacterium]